MSAGLLRTDRWQEVVLKRLPNPPTPQVENQLVAGCGRGGPANTAPGSHIDSVKLAAEIGGD
jgi:hypothetical protein